MDIIRTLADPSGVNGWNKARLGLDGAIDHRLGMLEMTQEGNCDVRRWPKECLWRRSLDVNFR